MKRTAWIAPILAAAALVTVSVGLPTAAPVAAEVSVPEASVPEAESALVPCAAEPMGSCYEMKKATCYIWPPPGVEGEVQKQKGACDLNDKGCGPEKK